jgi:hypothetical protein
MLAGNFIAALTEDTTSSMASVLAGGADATSDCSKRTAIVCSTESWYSCTYEQAGKGHKTPQHLAQTPSDLILIQSLFVAHIYNLLDRAHPVNIRQLWFILTGRRQWLKGVDLILAIGDCEAVFGRVQASFVEIYEKSRLPANFSAIARQNTILPPKR